MCAEEFIKKGGRRLDSADRLMAYLRRIDFMPAGSSYLVASLHLLESGSIQLYLSVMDMWTEKDNDRVKYSTTITAGQEDFDIF